MRGSKQSRLKFSYFLFIFSMPKKYQYIINCVVPGCLTKSTTQNTFVRFPKYGTPKFYKWINLIGRNDLQTKTNFICKNHFTVDCFGFKGRLLQNRTPSFFSDLQFVKSRTDKTYIGQKRKKKEDEECNVSNNNNDNNSSMGDNYNISDNIKVRAVRVGNEIGNNLICNNSDISENRNLFGETIQHLKTYPGPKTFEDNLNIDDYDEFDFLNSIFEPNNKCSEYTQEENYKKPEEICKDCEKFKKSLQLLKNKYIKLKLKFKKKKKILTKSNRSKTYYQNKNITKKDNNITNIMDNLKVSDNSKLFSKILLKKRKKTEFWQENERELCLRIFLKSPSFYTFLKDNLKFQLPSASSLHRWLPIDSVQPGINGKLFEVLKKKFTNESTTAAEKLAVLVFDEIHIRSELEYNSRKDLIDGVCTDGINRENMVGKEICVFTIRGLVSSWSYIVGHIVSSSAIPGIKLETIVMSIIDKCFDSGIKVKAIVCDQGSNNRWFYKKLNISSENTYFTRNRQQIYCFFCICHLIKSCRNCLMDNKLQTECGTTKWSVINELYEIDQGEYGNSVTRMLPKITANHVHPNTFAKMKVSYATQILSHSVAAAIRTTVTLAKFSEEVSEFVESTAEFCEKFNNLFDIFNSQKRFGGSIYKSAFTKNNKDQEYFLMNMVSYIKNIKILTKNSKGGKKTVYVFNGLLLNIMALINMSNDIFNTYNDVEYILTRRLNQDILENLFAIIRGKGGYNRYPSVREFNYHLRCFMNMKTIDPQSVSKYANTLCDADLVIESERVNDVIKSLNFDDLENYENQIEENFDFHNNEDNFIHNKENIDENKEKVDISSNSRSYFIGYVVHKVNNKINCKICKEKLLKKINISYTLREQLLYEKNYENAKIGLKLPTNDFYDICDLQINYFEKTFKDLIAITNIKQFYIEKLVEITNISYPDWYSEKDKCKSHKLEILGYLILILIRKNCKWSLDEKNNFPGRLKVLQQ